MESTIACSLCYLVSLLSYFYKTGLDKCEKTSEQIIKHTLINVIKGSSYEEYF